MALRGLAAFYHKLRRSACEHSLDLRCATAASRARYAQFVGAVVIPKKIFAEAAVSVVIYSDKNFATNGKFFLLGKIPGRDFDSEDRSTTSMKACAFNRGGDYDLQRSSPKNFLKPIGQPCCFSANEKEKTSRSVVFFLFV